MEPSQYLAVLRKRWLVIAVSAGLGVIAAFGVSQATTPTYRASSAVFVSLERGDTVSELVQGSTYTQNLVQSYAQLVTLPVVLDPVIAGLDLDTDARSLAATVSADTPLNTVIIEISAESPSPELAAQTADAVAAQLAVAVRDVSPKGPDGSETITIRTVSPAQAPQYAFSPNTRLNLATGLVVGLGLGMAIALAGALLSTRIRTTEDVARVTSTPVLSGVPRTRDGADLQPVMISQPLSPRAESYRRLRANLQFFGVSDSLRSVVVTSALPGEGKSTTAINLALALAEGPSRVLLVDADLRRPSVADYMGLEGSVGLTTVLIGRATVEDVVQQWGSERLDVLPSGGIPPNPSQLLDSPEMAALIRQLTSHYDIVVFDSAPLLPVADSAILSRLTDGAVVVAAARDLHHQQLAAALATLEAVGASCLGVVLNRVSGPEASTTYGYAPHELESRPSARVKWSPRHLGRRRPTQARPTPPAPIRTPPPAARTLTPTWPARSASGHRASVRTSSVPARGAEPQGTPSRGR